jgi:hypothetical protein
MKIIINSIELNKYELLHLINSGKKLSAIKLVKTKTNMGLKECKDVIDNLSDNPNFYDDNDYVLETDFVEAYEKPKRIQSRKGSHVINSNTTNYKNYVILFLLLCIIVLVYMYYTK